LELFSTSSEIIEKKLVENIRMTKSVFSDTTNGVDEIMSDLCELTRIMSEVSKRFEENPKYQANFDLFARSRQLLFASYNCLLTGNYGSAKCLFRSVLENAELMLQFHLDPKKVIKWRSNPDWWRKNENKPSSVRARIFSILPRNDGHSEKKFSDLYGELSQYIHPRPRGWKEIKEKRKDGKWYIIRIPLFYRDVANETLGKILILIYITVGAFETTYHEFLSSNPEINSKVDKIFERIRNLFPRHTR